LILRTPEVKDLPRVKIRQAGPFVFIEVTIKVKKSADIIRAHTISDTVEKQVKERFPIVESVIVHVEPHRSSQRRVCIPTEEGKGMESKVSNHFGRAPYFAFIDIEGDEITSIHFEENAFQVKKIQAGLAASNEVVKKQIDVLVTRELGEISFHTLRDNLVEIFLMKGDSLREVLGYYLSDGLKPTTSPTKTSEKEEGDLLFGVNEKSSIGLRNKGISKRYELGRLGSIGKGELRK
jgi:predicted Fe-Mo cluster-binding NifX family protein